MEMNALISLAVLTALLCVIFGPWQGICTDIARQKIFEARDAIFDLAHEGKLDFNSAEYKTIRRSLEKSIRFAHEATLVRYIWLSTLLKKRGRINARSDLSKAVAEIQDEQTRKKVESLVRDAYKAMTAMMAFKSPLLFFLIAGIFLVYVPCLMVRNKVNALRTTIIRDVMNVSRKVGERVQMEAEAA